MVKSQRLRKCQMCGKPSFGKRCMDCYQSEKHRTLSRMYYQKRKEKYVSI